VTAGVVIATFTPDIWRQMVNPRISRYIARARRGRILMSLTVAFLSAGVLVGSVGAVAAFGGTRPRACGFLWRYFTDVSARGATCPTARRVARRYMAAALGLHPRFPGRELGFRCRRINTGNAGGGWVAQCHKGRAIVYMIPT
jgi:hypothetical protein